jgi:SAM-dependent methyltransferase
MKLSELVAYRNQLNRLHISEAKTHTELDFSKIKHLVNSKDFDPNNIKGQLQDKHNEVYQKFDEFVALVEQAKQEAQQEINLKEQFWLEETYRLYSQEMTHDSDEHILNRRPTLSEEHDNIIRARIKNFSNHLHPGMIIRPGLETFIEDMVSFDPLYLVDQSEELLFPSMIGFPEQYRRRLRPYVIDRNETGSILSKLPDNQFGMCLAYNFFNFTPIQVIEKYLVEIFSKLKPGGRLMMTFNDCDNEKAVRLAESYYTCYTPGRLVKEIAQRVGYEIYFIWNDNDPSTWLELQKPGILTTLRGGQALAKVVPIPDPNWKPPIPEPDPNANITVRYDPEKHDFYKHRDLRHQILTLGLLTEQQANRLTTRQLEQVLNTYKNNQKT